VIEAEGVTLRPWAEADAPALAALADCRAIWLNLRDRFPHPYRLADAEAWVRFCAAHAGPPLDFALYEGGRLVGGIGVEPQSDVDRLTGEIGYWVGEAHWGRGIATRALRAASLYAFSTLGLERLEASVFEWNPASARVLEKAGFQREGTRRRSVLKDGRLGDSHLYARLRGP
jgi:RimJ/RimL family protein N-acetyltransferase